MQQLPMGFMDKAGPFQPLLEPIMKSVLGVVVDMKVDFEVDMFWNRVNGQRVIQAHAPPQPPVIEHPDTSLPTWFCNIHSHSAMLRDERDGVLPETTGASKLNKSDVFYGDGTVIPADVSLAFSISRTHTHHTLTCPLFLTGFLSLFLSFFLGLYLSNAHVRCVSLSVRLCICVSMPVSKFLCPGFHLEEDAGW